MQLYAIRHQTAHRISIRLLTAGQQREWQVLVRRFRSLRATLLTERDISYFSVRVYLWSTDVSLRAVDHAECLKALQALVHQLLPVFTAQQSNLQILSLLADSNSELDTEVCTASPDSNTSTCWYQTVGLKNSLHLALADMCRLGKRRLAQQRRQCCSSWNHCTIKPSSQTRSSFPDSKWSSCSSR